MPATRRAQWARSSCNGPSPLPATHPAPSHRAPTGRKRSIPAPKQRPSRASAANRNPKAPQTAGFPLRGTSPPRGISTSHPRHGTFCATRHLHPAPPPRIAAPRPHKPLGSHFAPASRDISATGHLRFAPAPRDILRYKASPSRASAANRNPKAPQTAGFPLRARVAGHSALQGISIPRLRRESRPCGPTGRWAPTSHPRHGTFCATRHLHPAPPPRIATPRPRKPLGSRFAPRRGTSPPRDISASRPRRGASPPRGISIPATSAANRSPVISQTACPRFAPRLPARRLRKQQNPTIAANPRMSAWGSPVRRLGEAPSARS